jgi:hypothetical protein
MAENIKNAIMAFSGLIEHMETSDTPSMQVFDETISYIMDQIPFNYEPSEELDTEVVSILTTDSTALKMMDAFAFCVEANPPTLTVGLIPLAMTTYILREYEQGYKFAQKSKAFRNFRDSYLFILNS